MPDRMGVLLDATLREAVAMLAAYGQRPTLELTRALRAKFAVALNAARLVGVLHAQSPTYRSPALPEAETGGWADDADTIPSHRPRH